MAVPWPGRRPPSLNGGAGRLPPPSGRLRLRGVLSRLGGIRGMGGPDGGASHGERPPATFRKFGLPVGISGLAAATATAVSR
jgi:hypothetical protein